MRKKKQECPPPGAPGWVVTYGDMMSLILTFFILLISFSTIEQVKFKAAISSIQEGMGFFPENASLFMRIKTDAFPQSTAQQEAAMVVSEIIETLKETESLGEIELYNTPERIRLVISNPLPFESGKAELRPQFKQVLNEVARIIRPTAFTEVRVEGHTDNVPINTYLYPSNWELSAARALAATKYLAFVGGLDPAHLSAVGYGEYRPRATNDTAEGRGKNRRVEIFLERSPESYGYGFPELIK